MQQPLVWHTSCAPCKTTTSTELCSTVNQPDIEASPIRPVLYALHWLPVRFRIEYKIAVITFKTIHGMAPKYLHDLIDIRQNRHYNLRSNKGIVLCDASGKFKRTMGDRSLEQRPPRYGTNCLMILKSPRS